MWRWKLAAWSLWLGFFPVVGLAMYLLPDRFQFVALGYFLLIVGNGLLLGFAECPRCGKPFNGKYMASGLRYRNILTWRCLNCGLSLSERKSGSRDQKTPDLKT